MDTIVGWSYKREVESLTLFCSLGEMIWMTRNPLRRACHDSMDPSNSPSYMMGIIRSDNIIMRFLFQWRVCQHSVSQKIRCYGWIQNCNKESLPHVSNTPCVLHQGVAQTTRGGRNPYARASYAFTDGWIETSKLAACRLE